MGDVRVGVAAAATAGVASPGGVVAVEPGAEPGVAADAHEPEPQMRSNQWLHFEFSQAIVRRFVP